jgi:transcriptional regulator with XRE-family HTH domain
VRALRQHAGLTIVDLAAEIRRADGRPYSASFVSRLERGWASPPLYVYCLLAARFEVAPGELLGSEGVERAVDDAELTLVRVVRRLGLAPEDAIARLAAPTRALPG